MNENTRDYNYIALELTKIRYQNNDLPSKTITNNNTIMDTFEFYLTELINTNDNMNDIIELKEENESLKIALQTIQEELNKPSVVDKKKEKLITTINANRGNMEPWLANELIDIINIDN